MIFCNSAVRAAVGCRVLVLVWGLVLSAGGVVAQDTTDVAGMTEQLTASTGVARVDLLLDLSESLTAADPERCRSYGREALNLARAAGDSARAGKALMALGRSHVQTADYERSLDYGLQALRVAEGLDDAAFHARVLNSLGTLQQRLGRYDEAAAYYDRSLAMARETGDQLGEARNLNSLGVNAWYQADYAQAQEFYAASLAVQRRIGDPQGVAVALNNLAMVHHVREDYPRAVELYEESLVIKREIGYTTGEAATLGNLGELCLSMGRYPAALAYLEQSRDLAAEQHAADVLVNAHYSLADYHAAVGDHAAALREFRLASEKEQEIFSARNAALVAEMQEKYEAEQRTREIDRLNLENARAAEDLAQERRERNRSLFSLVVALFAIVVLGWLYRRLLRAHGLLRTQARELEAAAAKINALTELLPICASCKKIRDEDGDWHQLESYLRRHADLSFTHGICPACKKTALEAVEKA